jgi:hypothetical protein
MVEEVEADRVPTDDGLEDLEVVHEEQLVEELELAAEDELPPD